MQRRASFRQREVIVAAVRLSIMARTGARGRCVASDAPHRVNMPRDVALQHVARRRLRNTAS
jgi:hypothetical protein